MIFAICLCWPGTAFSQGEGYVLGPGDILTLTIFAGGKTRESLDITVSNEGTVNVPFLGEIRAANKTVKALSDDLRTGLARDFFVDPQVILAVKEFKSREIYITGAVEKPGLYPLDKGITLLELIARAGGVTQERGNQAYVLRGSIKTALESPKIDQLIDKTAATSVNLKDLFDKADTSKNIKVEPGDVVYIQPAFFSDSTQHKVYVLGHVKQPGVFEYQEGLTALNACALAGGFDKYGAPNRTIITRKTTDGKVEKLEINLEKVQEGENKDLLLKPGDRIFVPESWL